MGVRRLRLGLVLGGALAAACGCSTAAPPPSAPPEANAPAAARLVRGRYLMGTEMEVELVGASRDRLVAASEKGFAEIERVEGVFTDWKPGSVIWELNERAHGSAVAASAEVLDVIERADAVSSETDGAFDVTYRTVGRYWSFAAGSERVASDEEIRAALPHLGFRKIVVDRVNGTLRLTDPEARIGLGGVAKGYAVDRAVEVLRGEGVTSGIVNAGGDLAVFHHDPRAADATPIALRDPARPEVSLATIRVCDASVHTSGDYERYFERDGVRYHHLLDPRTGRPARGARAVTVVAPRDGTRADALATGLFVMGAERAIAWADAHPGVEALAVAPDGTVLRSRGWAALERAGGEVRSPDGREPVDGCGR